MYALHITKLYLKMRFLYAEDQRILFYLQSSLFSGHTRTGSEISAAGSEDSVGNGTAASSAEVDRLLKRISELNEVVEAREGKLVELSRANHELGEKNTDLNR